MQGRPSSPSEADRRLYARVIEPLRQDLDGAAHHDLTFGILDTFLAPLDLTTNPTTFGPEDEDPFFPLRVEVKKIDDKEFIGTIAAPPDAQALLKVAFTEARRVESMTVLQRIGDSVPAPFKPETQMFGPMKARSVRELGELAEVLNPPRTIKRLFIPSSRYFMRGFTSVPRLPTAQAAPLEVIDAAWRLAPQIGQEVKNLTQKAAMTRKATLDRIWERWNSIQKEMTDWQTLDLPSPMFPMRTSRDPVVSFEQSAELVTCSILLLNTAQTDRRPTPTMADDALRQVRDIDPYSTSVLDEFDEVLSEELSVTVRPSESSRHSESQRLASIHSRASKPISAWKHSSSIDLSSSSFLFGVRDAYERGDYEMRGMDRRFLDGPSGYDNDHWDAMDTDPSEWDDEMFDQTHGQLAGYPESEYITERFHPSSRPDRAAELAQLAQPWGQEKRRYGLQSPLSIRTQIPLGADFARHGMDWRMPLQSSPPLASPIKMREPPTPDSGDAFFTDYQYRFGPARTLTYGEDADHENGGFDHGEYDDGDYDELPSH